MHACRWWAVQNGFYIVVINIRPNGWAFNKTPAETGKNRDEDVARGRELEKGTVPLFLGLALVFFHQRQKVRFVADGLKTWVTQESLDRPFAGR